MGPVTIRQSIKNIKYDEESVIYFIFSGNSCQIVVVVTDQKGPLGQKPKNWIHCPICSIHDMSELLAYHVSNKWDDEFNFWIIPALLRRIIDSKAYCSVVWCSTMCASSLKYMTFIWPLQEKRQSEKWFTTSVRKKIKPDDSISFRGTWLRKPKTLYEMDHFSLLCLAGLTTLTGELLTALQHQNFISLNDLQSPIYHERTPNVINNIFHRRLSFP